MRLLESAAAVPVGRHRKRATHAAALAMPLVLVLMLSGRPATAQAPGTGAAAPLARYLPQQDLSVYLEFEGLDSHAAAWHKSAAYKLLNDTSLGALLEDI